MNLTEYITNVIEMIAKIVLVTKGTILSLWIVFSENILTLKRQREIADIHNIKYDLKDSN